MIPVSAPGEAERTPATTRLRELARYISLVADEMEALERHDPGRLRELAEKRKSLEKQLLSLPDAPAEPEEECTPLPLSAELCSLLETALTRLDQFATENRQERARWIALGDDALRSLQGTGLRSTRGGQYVEFSSTDGRLDVKF